MSKKTKGRMRLSASSKDNEFRKLFAYVNDLWRKGRVSTNLWSYWLTSVVIFGGIGVWTSLVLQCNDWQMPNILLSLITLSPPIAATACLDFVFISDKERYLTGPAIFFGCIVGVVVCLSALLKNYKVAAYGFALLGILLAYAVSWLSSARNPKFVETGSYSAPIGGDTLTQVAGTAKGYNL